MSKPASFRPSSGRWGRSKNWIGMSAVGLILLAGRLEAQETSPAASATNQYLVVVIQGTVEVAGAGTAVWTAAKVNQILQPGDQLRTRKYSHATVRFSGLSPTQLDENTLLTIPVSPKPGRNPAVRLLRGVMNFFNRDKPARFDVETPTASAAIRGTEFNLAVAESGATTLALFDGEVELSNDLGKIVLAAGDQGTVAAGQAPVKTAVIDAVNIIQWCLYYPGVLDVAELELTAEEQQGLRESLLAYRSGDLKQALASYPADRQPTSDSEKVYSAALLLAVGQVEAAETQLKSLSREGAEKERAARLAEALRLLIAAVKFQPRPSPGNAGPVTLLTTESLAESYYLQSRSQLKEALEAARRAAGESHEFGFAWERVAEMEFSFGNTATALKALAKAKQLSPRNAQAFALQGFLLSAQNRVKEAMAAFDEAIALDPALGNAWLGRGLCRIRQGRAEAGREDLQMAAALEPQRALFRSYLGKAFSNAGDYARGAKELELAKQKDPNDPTAWLYSALLKQQQNRINEAVGDLETSQELNQNRQVYRSGLLLDQDRAVRSANLAAIYQDAGMFDVSVREAARAVNADYANFSSHLFLANSYNASRDPKLVNLRYETPSFSEYLVGNLLAPVGAGTLSPYISQQEYARLFERDHLGLSSSTEYFSRGDWVQTASQYGTFSGSSYSLDVAYRSETGQRPNNDLRQLSASGIIRQQLTPQDTMYLQALYADYRSGDLRQYYDQASANTTFRTTESQEPSLFLGYHREWRPGIHTLLLVGRLQDDFRVSDSAAEVLTLFRNPSGELTTVLAPRFRRFSLINDSEFAAYSVELQQLCQWGDQALIVGGRYQTGETDTHAELQKSPPAFTSYPGLQENTTDLERLSFYAYDNWQVWKPLWLTTGLSYDRLSYPENVDLPPISDRQLDKDQVSPKVGLIWTPAKATSFRGAYTRSLGGLYYDTSVRLEPTQVGGFNQAFRSLIPESVSGIVAGSGFETWSVGVDHRFNTRTYVSVEGEVLKSEAERAIGVFEYSVPAAVASTTPQKLDYEERSLVLSLNQLLGKEWSWGARYRLSHADLDAHLTEIPTRAFGSAVNQPSATLHQLYLFGLWNHSSGFFGQFQSVWSAQSNQGYLPDIPGDDFWQFSCYAGYRFPRRKAEVRVGLLNINDQDYQLNPLNLYAELPRERTLTVSFKFNF